MFLVLVGGSGHDLGITTIIHQPHNFPNQTYGKDLSGWSQENYYKQIIKKG